MKSALSNQEAVIAILLMGLITFFLRALPFLLFTRKQREIPKAVNYLGNVLPYASMVLLVVYCLRNVNLSDMASAVPLLIGILSVALLQLWKRNSTISIFGGTAIYMVLLQVMTAI